MMDVQYDHITYHPEISKYSKSDSSSMTSDESLTSSLEGADLRCGYEGCKPPCLQRCNNSKSMLATLSWFVFVQSFVVSGIVNVNTTTLERSFDLSSSQVAWISSSYDLCGGLLGFIIGYLAIFANKPRLMTVSAAIMALGSFVMFLPHVLVEPYKLGTKQLDTCDIKGNSTMSCDNSSRSDLSRFVYVLIVGQVLHGVGGIAAYTVGTPVVDESTTTKNSPMYIGIMHGMAALGPAVGFLFGGVMLHFYVDIDRMDMSTVDVTPDDPRWVGAWWIGFAVAGVAGVTVVFLLACFAEELPGSLIVPGAAIGQVLGGFIPRWLDLRARGLTLQCAVGCGLTLALSFTFVFRCAMVDLAGVTAPYHNTSTPYELSQDCNADCGCSLESYEPVCGSDGVQYFSSCHAGCTNSRSQDGLPTKYFNCSCIPTNEELGSSEANITSQTATEGPCVNDCNAVKIFLPFVFLMTLGTFLANTAFFSATMRIVPNKQRAFACGLQSSLIRFLGATPFPLLFGILFDRVCLVWQETCEGRGSCWIYDNQTLGRHIMYMIIGVKCISSTCFLIAFLVYRPPKMGSDDNLSEKVVIDIPTDGSTNSVLLSLDNTTFDSLVVPDPKPILTSDASLIQSDNSRDRSQREDEKNNKFDEREQLPDRRQEQLPDRRQEQLPDRRQGQLLDRRQEQLPDRRQEQLPDKRQEQSIEVNNSSSRESVQVTDTEPLVSNRCGLLHDVLHNDHHRVSLRRRINSLSDHCDHYESTL